LSSIDTQRWLKLSALLDRALDLSPIERERWLEELRLQSPDEAAELAVMLDGHSRLRAEGFLDASPLAAAESSLTGVTIGSYTLLSRIGDGGMGSVWLGTRSDGRFEGQVAIKLLNASLVGRGGEERFRREGIILARLGHPHIARLIDAGVSNTGQPYLVLELVNGEHIDAHCADLRLSIERRIRLFLDVLAAVSHAHANLIVHRDLKPSNVLVNQAGAVKLLDFSIAKLMEDNGASRLTREAGSALTPKYAAPEQVAGGPITTRTDVYSLGVLLYELLSGQHPYGSAVIASSEFTQAIAEREPLRLSAAFAKATPDSRSLAAAQRSTTPDRLSRVLGGDLETILNKALKKLPDERYGSVAELADDLRRYLEHQPIAAQPDSIRYRASKFMRRHRRAVGTAAAAAAALVLVVAFYTWQLTAERDRARAQAEKASRVSELLTSVLISADPYRTPSEPGDGLAADPSARALLDTLAMRIGNELGDQPEVQAEMLTVIGRTYDRLGRPESALPLLERALAIGRRTFQPPDARVAQTLNDFGVLHRRLGNYAAAEPLIGESLAMRRAALGNADKDVAVTLVEHARVLRDLGRHDEAEAPVREALAIRQQIFGDEHRETATSKSDLGQLLLERGTLEEAEGLLRDSLDTTARLLGAEHPNTATATLNLANALAARGDLAAAERLQREAMAVRRKIFGANHPDVASAAQSLGGTLEMRGRRREAETLLREGLEIITAALGADHPRSVAMAVDLAGVRLAAGAGAAVETMARHALEIRQRLYPTGDWRIGQAQALVGRALLAQRRYADAEPLMIAADRVLQPIAGRQGRDRAANREALKELYEARGQTQRAALYR
jgi:eukaryotic-like serine/threonine-protein kinase